MLFMQEMAYKELAKRKGSKSGNLSSKDYEQVFRGIVGKGTKLRGFYDTNNRSQVNIPQGANFIDQSENLESLKQAMEEMGKQIEDMNGLMNAMSCEMNAVRTFIEPKFPAEDWRNMVVVGENNEVSICPLSFFVKRTIREYNMSLQYGLCIIIVGQYF